MFAPKTKYNNNFRSVLDDKAFPMLCVGELTTWSHYSSMYTFPMSPATTTTTELVMKLNEHKNFKFRSKPLTNLFLFQLDAKNSLEK